MDRYRNILLYVDPSAPSGAAYKRAIRLCKESGAKLRLLAVTPELSVYLRYPPFYPSLELTLRADAQSALLTLMSSALKQGLDVSTTVRHGKPFLEIAREAKSGGHDLALLDSQPDDAESETTAMRLFRVCPCAVWAVRPTPSHTYTRILAAVDPGTREPGEPGLNQQILDTALRVAELDGGRVDVLHAWSPGPGGAPFRDQVAAAAVKSLDNFVEPYELPKDRIHLVEGDAAHAIRAFVEQNATDLVVMGTIVRTGIAGMLIGNTAERALGALPCSVLALKPAGFISPVEEA